VHRHLAILRRNNGVLQVTLRSHPLYHYSGDHAKGEANGQSIHSFGGTWHVLSLSSSVFLRWPVAAAHRVAPPHLHPHR
jgi:hypothetical protein